MSNVGKTNNKPSTKSLRMDGINHLYIYFGSPLAGPTARPQPCLNLQDGDGERETIPKWVVYGIVLPRLGPYGIVSTVLIDK